MFKHIPNRMCICCRKVKPKNELIRVVKNESGFSVDRTSKADGRGCYVCKDAVCLEKFVKSRALNRSFKMPVPSEIYATIESELNHSVGEHAK